MNENINASLGKNRRLWLWLGFWVVLFVIMHVPPNELASHIGDADKVVHFVAYFILASLGAYHVGRSHGGPAAATLIGWALVYFVYAACDEWLQRFVNRTPSFWDWLADATGVLVATGIAMLWSHRSRARLSEPAGRVTADKVTPS